MNQPASSQDQQTGKQENTWRGSFGDEYTQRNQFDDVHITECAETFSQIFKSLPADANLSSILEVGCNLGRNLEALSKITDAELFGIEPNDSARGILQGKGFIKPDNIKNAIGVDIPFDDEAFDLVFTSVVLIHVPDNQIEQTLREIYRTSKRFILAKEYFNPSPTTIQYRGHSDLLFKRDYGSMYMDMFPDLKLLDYGFFWKRVVPCQDNTTWWLFEKNGA